MGNGGYKQPPKEHQFKEGHAGGPGRPKGSLGIKRLFREELERDDGKYAKEIAENVVRSSKYDLRWLQFLLKAIDEVDD